MAKTTSDRIVTNLCWSWVAQKSLRWGPTQPKRTAKLFFAKNYTISTGVDFALQEPKDRKAKKPMAKCAAKAKAKSKGKEVGETSSKVKAKAKASPKPKAKASPKAKSRAVPKGKRAAAKCKPKAKPAPKKGKKDMGGPTKFSVLG